MKLTVLGSGISTTAPGTPFRFPATHLIETENEKILFDAGIGVMPQLAKLNIRPQDIDAICISHYHADHFVLEPILQAFFLYGRFGESVRLRILGPSDIEERVRTSYKTKGWTFDNDLLKNADITFTPYEDGKPIQIGQSTLTPHKTTHLGLEAYTLHLENDGKVIAYSGDSGIDDALGKAAKGSDIFLCEALQRIGEAGTDIHIGAKDAGAVAKEQGSKHVVLTHYTGLDSPEVMIEAVKSSGYSGEVSVAADLSSYEV